MQMGGNGYASRMADARAEFHRNGRFQDLALRYVQAHLVQTAQSAGCNSRHDIGQRLARWLCLCADRSKGSTMPLTQEFLADMLGSNRPTVTTAAGMLMKADLITYHRGMVTILDRPGLEAYACECYQVVKTHLDSLLEVDQD
jgi:CRP-like cAMP-binding protein